MTAGPHEVDPPMLSVEDVRAALGDELLAERPGAMAGFVRVTNDSRVARAGELFVALRTPDPRTPPEAVRDGHDFLADALSKGVAGLVVSREVAAPEGVAVFRVRDTKHAIGELARFWRRHFYVAKSVVITGNVGKTTTKELIAAVLSTKYEVLKSTANFNDEIGLSMTLFGLEERHQRIVLEAGMFELGEIRRLCEIAQPEIGVVLNVGPTHLERLGSMEAIAAAKAEAVQGLPWRATAVLNADDPYVAAMETKTKARVLRFGLAPGADVRATDVRPRGLSGVDFTLTCGARAVAVHSGLPGAALVSNALAAAAVAIADGLSVEEAGRALSSAAVPLRLAAKLAPGGATILDDAYNAGPASMLAALGVLGETAGRRLALLGDMLELGSAEAEGHRSVGECAAAVVDALYTIGPRGEQIAAAARAAGARAVRHFESRTEAAAELRRVLGPGDVLLVKASHGLALGAVVAELMRE